MLRRMWGNTCKVYKMSKTSIGKIVHKKNSLTSELGAVNLSDYLLLNNRQPKTRRTS